MVNDMDKLVNAQELIERIKKTMESAPLSDSNHEPRDERVWVISISQLLEISKDILELNTWGAWIPARDDYIQNQLQTLLDQE